MLKLVIAGLFGLVATAAVAQDYDHGRTYRHEEHGPARVLRHFFVGRSVGHCRLIVTRRQAPDGNWIVTRRRVCDHY